ncbi:hypothetical protein ACFOZ0_08075 [Streptomyces yaanensis]|uniref:DUF397 domain-containing protein n=1 Tax=Streptomyces yaanensis TaxID=1142239 RepID=A0ABV7SAH9_9ACTN|nr:hypothetical protein [Streptomyces sp. CGMCC 4.7035]WNC02734.1 hypothetical protein Q2K21_34340 [Streptomyces sp. CGMCC 4.7035]
MGTRVRGGPGEGEARAGRPLVFSAVSWSVFVEQVKGEAELNTFV